MAYLILLFPVFIFLFLKDNFIESIFYNNKTMFVGKYLVSLREKIFQIIYNE